MELCIEWPGEDKLMTITKKPNSKFTVAEMRSRVLIFVKGVTRRERTRNVNMYTV